MSRSQQQKVGRELSQRWNVDPLHHYWYPLWEGDLPSDVLALQAWYFYQEVGAAALQEILLGRGISRIWEINELRLPPEYEMDPSLCEFSGSEAYWSSKQLDWLIYVSHEDSITFAGFWLVDEIKRAWPNWGQRIYTGYDYERSLS